MTLVPLNDINSGHYSRVVLIKGVTFNQVNMVVCTNVFVYKSILRNNHLPKATWLTEHSKIFWSTPEVHNNTGAKPPVVTVYSNNVLIMEDGVDC